MWLYSETKLNSDVFKGADGKIYLTKSVDRPYERFNILDTKGRELAADKALLAFYKNRKLNIYKNDKSYNLTLPADFSLPLDAASLRKSPLRDVLLSIAGKAPLDKAAPPVALAVSVFYIRTEDNSKRFRVTQRRSANSRAGYLYEIPDSYSTDADFSRNILPFLLSAGFRRTDYVEYILESFMNNNFSDDLTTPEKTERRGKAYKFANALIVQLENMKNALAEYNAGGDFEAMRELNDSIFNLFVLFYGRPDFSEDENSLAEIALVISELAEEIRVFDDLLLHLECDEDCRLKTAVVKDKEAVLAELNMLCKDFENDKVIEYMIGQLSAHPKDEDYDKYSKQQTKALLKDFKKTRKRLKEKQSISRYNDFYEALASLYYHMELLGLCSGFSNCCDLKVKLHKYMEKMEDYSAKLNTKILVKDYSEELGLNKEDVKALNLPKADKAVLKKILKKAKKLYKDYLKDYQD